jgi:hypothetical protein
MAFLNESGLGRLWAHICTKLSNTYMLESKNLLAKGEDLNDAKFLVCGQWTCGSESTALQLSNCPIAAAFKFTTEQIVQEYNLLQTITPYYYYEGGAYSRPFKFMRTARSTDEGATWTFGEWDGAVSTGAFANTVKKTGDTMTGNLTFDDITRPTIGMYSLANSEDKKAYGCIYKNANATDDYGLQLRDYTYGEFDDNQNSSMFIISNKKDLDEKLMFANMEDGTTTLYKIYGEHNKPAPGDIGAYTKDEVDEEVADVLRYTEQTLTDSQKSKARENINAMKSIPYGTSLPLSGEIGDIFLLIEE